MFRQLFVAVFYGILFTVQVNGFINGWSQASNVLLTGSKTYLSYSDSIAAGAHHAMSECRSQFQWDRWNCPDNSLTLFTELTPTKEMSFVHAISAAGVMYTLTKNCSMGHFAKCSCDNRKVGQQGGDNWQWGGCSDNVDFGERVAKRFLDGLETGEDTRAVTNLHNNDVGRKAVRKTMQRQCKCHGVSGSCSIQTCWDQLADFHVVGALLKRKYLDAIRVDYVRGELIGDETASAAAALSNSRHSRRDEQKVSNHLDFPKRDLIYLEKSPNYCSANSTLGTRGTAGRECLRKPRDSNELIGNADMEAWEHRSCKRLCTKCGLQVEKTKIVVESSCNCQFQWCCSVTCDKCLKEITRYTCSES